MRRRHRHGRAVLAWGHTQLRWRHARGLFWAMAPIALSIPFACVYLRYHYVVDVLAGIALAIAVALLARKLSPAPEGAPR